MEHFFAKSGRGRGLRVLHLKVNGSEMEGNKGRKKDSLRAGLPPLLKVRTLQLCDRNIGRNGKRGGSLGFYFAQTLL